jgi:hypothetical protein
VLRFSAVAFDASSLLSGAVLGVAGKWLLDIASKWFDHHLQIRRDREVQRLKIAEEERQEGREKERQARIREQEQEQILQEDATSLLRLREELMRSRPTNWSDTSLVQRAINNIRLFFTAHPQYLYIEANREYLRRFCGTEFSKAIRSANASFDNRKEVEEAIRLAENLRIAPPNGKDTGE